MTTATQTPKQPATAKTEPVVRRTLHGLVARCIFELSGKSESVPSKNLFSSREAAERDKENFARRLREPQDFDLDVAGEVVSIDHCEYVLAE